MLKRPFSSFLKNRNLYLYSKLGGGGGGGELYEFFGGASGSHCEPLTVFRTKLEVFQYYFRPLKLINEC